METFWRVEPKINMGNVKSQPILFCCSNNDSEYSAHKNNSLQLQQQKCCDSSDMTDPKGKRRKKKTKQVRNELAEAVVYVLECKVDWSPAERERQFLRLVQQHYRQGRTENSHRLITARVRLLDDSRLYGRNTAMRVSAHTRKWKDSHYSPLSTEMPCIHQTQTCTFVQSNVLCIVGQW